jgi:hypothetical protein
LTHPNESQPAPPEEEVSLEEMRDALLKQLYKERASLKGVALVQGLKALAALVQQDKAEPRRPRALHRHVLPAPHHEARGVPPPPDPHRDAADAVADPLPGRPRQDHARVDAAADLGGSAKTRTSASSSSARTTTRSEGIMQVIQAELTDNQELIRDFGPFKPSPDDGTSRGRSAA